MEIKNAKITDTMLGREDHGIMTFMIYVDISESGSCGIGGWALDGYDRETQSRVFSAKGAEVISKILDVVGVDTWEQLSGTYIRVKDRGWGETIDEIGNLMTNKWFNLRDFFSEGE